MSLRQILRDVEKGVFPAADGGVTMVPQPSERDAGVFSFTAHAVVFADTDHDWMRGLLPPDDLAAPLSPAFLDALGRRVGRRVVNIDMMVLAEPLPGPPDLPLEPTSDRSHPRIVRALLHRDDVRAWTTPGGTVLIGRGVAGRWEPALEVDPGARGTGLGRRLARAARHLVPDGEPLWAQIAPGNASSVRAFLAAGYVPVGAEAMLIRGHG
ncbi:GNAT family N-acetyltransferase [Streptomyces sp. H10-C2]|uniref:GNAT family N-acetyltransferase n=1 Tax=unclassified Streptomyces TaxID=2593676 RepID=UPI0024B97BD1|nr:MULTISPECIES: GNAT family N-acetyltransferase [unclassified Streptomyces]MDJ0344103.1 GNAT family N-acetyltransferase [Streptomyces sp. PH10-H1]MDJ0368642.1 GNAT family N-acetyltransferase [Streptomyces sp. H10-C2]